MKIECKIVTLLITVVRKKIKKKKMEKERDCSKIYVFPFFFVLPHPTPSFTGLTCQWASMDED